jgi:hypothetical protein
MNTLEAIAKVEFVATDAQVEQLAGIAADGRQAGGTYLKVLVAHVRAALTGKRKPSRSAQRAAVDETHKRLYEHVMRGVGPTDLEQAERNRRATFARTAASTLRHYAKRGDLRTLEPAEVTKAKLRGRTRVPAGTRSERVMTRTADTFVRLVQRVAKADPAAARKRIAAMQSQLTKLLFAIGDKKPPAKVVEKSKGAMRKAKAPVRKVPRTIRPFVAELRA